MGKVKKITSREKKFAAQVFDGYKPIEAARKVFGWKCEPYTKEAQKAKDLARTLRIRKELKKLKEDTSKLIQAENILTVSSKINWENLRVFAFDRLKEIRDDPGLNAKTRFEAISALEKLNDPTQDLNLIYRYIDYVWAGLTAHCPCCHEDFPLSKVNNPRLTGWRVDMELEEGPPLETEIERRLYLLAEAEKRRTPHEKQLEALQAPERHIVGQGAARAGKSFLLAMFGFMMLLLPGVEIWLLARVYDEARTEFEYIQDFLRTVFYPVDKYMFNITYDKKSGEATITTRWGSELRIKSGKSQGSITGRELEGILVAEPAWVDADLFEEVRARMSSRLGRIIALGTPKGLGGFLGRLTRMGSRDMRTGKRLDPGARLIINGCVWGQSIVQYHMDPKANPEYVQSEIEAARAELTAAEFAAEFEGLAVVDKAAKFPFITDEHLMPLKREWLTDALFVQGVDQGERNFAGCTIGWDGKNAYVVGEYFDNTDLTVKANMIAVNSVVPSVVKTAGGQRANWQLTIFDADPPVFGQLQELENENRPWTTEILYRPKNLKEFMNWREETCMWVNQLAKEGRLFFDYEQTDLLHEQLKDALSRPTPEGAESKARPTKGWIINDPWRGDHVPDAFLMAMWTLYTGMLVPPEKPYEIKHDVWEEARRSQEYRRRVDEDFEMTGFGRMGVPTNRDAIFEETFGRPRRRGMDVLTGSRGYYSDES